MKVMLKLVVAVVVVLVVAAGALLYYIDALAKKAIEEGGSEALGVSTTLDQVNISLLGGEASLRGLKIANPSGFSAPNFMGLGSGDFAISLDSLRSDTVVIPKVRFADIQVNLEQKNKTNNIQPLINRIKSLGGSGQSEAKSTSTEPGKKFVLQQLLIENVKVNAVLDLLGQTSKVNMVLPTIELRDLGKDQGGLPMDELVQKVVQAILATVQKSSASFSPELASLLSGELKGLDSIKTEVIGKASAEVDKKVKEATEQVKKQLQNVPLPSGTGNDVEEKAGKLIKGLFDK